MRHPAATLALAGAVLATAACASQPGTLANSISKNAPCTGTRTLTVRNSTRGVLEAYAATANGGNKVLLGEVQPGVSTFTLTPSQGGEFIAQRSGTSTIVAATPGVTSVTIRNNNVGFSVSCLK